MSNFYKLIHNENEVKQFIDFVLKDNETYLLQLFARTKWSPKITIKRSNRLRRIVTKETLLRELKRLEVQDTLYTDDAGVPLSSEDMAVYITYNPRCNRMASINLSKKILDTLCKGESFKRIESWLKTEIHKARKEKRYIMLDVDDKKIFAEEVEPFLEEHKIPVKVTSETQGGYHVLIEYAKMTKTQHKDLWNNWGKLSKDKKELCSIHPDSSTALPGTFQAGFKVKMINK